MDDSLSRNVDGEVHGHGHGEATAEAAEGVGLTVAAIKGVCNDWGKPPILGVTECRVQPIVTTVAAWVANQVGQGGQGEPCVEINHVNQKTLCCAYSASLSLCRP